MTKKKKTTRKKRRYYEARCETRGCDWRESGQGTLSKAATHARDNKHCVYVEIDCDRIYDYEEK